MPPAPIDDDVLFAPVKELAERIRKRELSPVALTDAYLARIEEHADLRAFVTVTPDLARAQARKAEQEIAAGNWRGMLHGIPWAAKDVIAVRWYPTTWGAAPLHAQKLAFDATVVQRLADAGAILLGKTAMIELAGVLGYRYPTASATGATLNPWNRARWAGGSSSGSAAAVAAGLCAFALGSETIGSLVVPAAYCGISTLRPTFGRVSSHGVMPGTFTLDKVGPLARTVEDCAAVLAAIACHDANDDASLPQGEAQFQWPPAKPPSRALRIGWIASPHGTSSAVDAAAHAAVEMLRKAGAGVETIALPDGPWSAAATTIVGAEAASSLRALIQSGAVAGLTDPLARIGGYVAETIPAADYVTAQRLRASAQKKLAALFQRFDVLAAATRAGVAPLADADLKSPDQPPPSPLTAIGNLCGLPAVSVPVGLSAEKLPIGLQLVGRPLDDHVVASVGHWLQQLSAWHKQRPPLD
jgi:aspartyl-tRNA(Asn)/glutamyl-tRNA(Gln) amidotransferase subunit A